MRRQQDAPSAPGDVIRLDGVTKAYQAGAPPALADVSMSVANGEVAAIMGPSGSGKSTLLNLIAGLDKPTSGTVTVAGQRIDALGEGALARFRARHVGIIFQFFNLLDDLTVEDNVLLPAQLAGASRRRARARAAELLARLGIEKHKDHYPARLSGGQRQRVAIARALVNSPELLLADEPTGALDTATGQEIGRLLTELNAAGQTLVLVTHDPALAVRYAARTIRLVDGQVVDPSAATAGAGVGGVSWAGDTSQAPATIRLVRPGSDGTSGADGGHGQHRPGAGHWLSVVRTASGGMLRHKVQAVVIVAVLFIATASATLGLALLNANNSPFTRAFAAQHGADVTVTANQDRATGAQLAATAHVAGVTAMAGPFDETTTPLEFQSQPWGPTTLVGRSDPSAPVDDVVLNAGHWADGPGQVVLAGNPAPGGGGPGNGGPVLGNTLTATRLPGKPVLTVVGFANSVTDTTGGGWVTPAELSSLLTPDSQPTAQLLYRFTSSATNAQLKADMAAVTKALPAGTVIDWGSWLTAQQSHSSNAAIMEPFVIAFALIGLAMAVLIVGNVISGAVIAQYQRIGVLKSLGLTPAQVVAVYLSRIGWPALAGCLIGVIGGYLLTIPVLHDSAGAYGVGSQQAPLWALLLAPAGMLAITLLAALGPALRAGRLSAIEAIASGRAPATGRGYVVHRLAARLNLPRPVGLGLAAPFARPARTLVTLAAIAFGATAVIFAVGLHSSLSDARAAQSLSATVPVQVWQNTGPNQVPTAAQFAAAAAAINAQPGAAHSNAEYGTQVNVVGFSQGVQTTVFGGPSSWMGYALISGHWYDAPGEVDVNTSFLTDGGLAVGDTTAVYTGTVTAGAKPVTVRIAGEIFDPGNQPRMYTAAQTLPGTAVPGSFWQWNVGLKPGTAAAAYSQGVNARLGGGSPFMAGPSNSGGQFYVIAIGLIGLLSLMVAVAAGLGVLNTVLMTTRDRIHDLGIFKSLGMRPGQVVVMVICWVVGPAVIAGAIAAPAAVALNTATLHAMAATSHTGIPASFTDVFPVPRLALLSLAALGIAVIGALLPAAWAARARPATALRAE